MQESFHNSRRWTKIKNATKLIKKIEQLPIIHQIGPITRHIEYLIIGRYTIGYSPDVIMIMKRLFFSLPRWILTAVVMAAIIYLTLVPRPLPDVDIPLFPGADKLVHAIMFGGLAGAITLDWVRLRGVTGLTCKCLSAIALIATLTGGVIELLQLWMAMGRGCELWDFVADGAGAVSGVWIARPIARWLMN